MKKGTLGLVAVTALLLGPAPAQAALLYQQTAGQVTSDSESSAYAAPNDHFSNQGADDFVVPEGVTWTIDRVDVKGSTGSEATQMNVFLYANSGTLPGTEIFSQTAIVSTGKPDFSIPLTGAPVLQPGRYWVSPQFSLATPQSAWFWARSNVTSGNPAAWRNPGDGSESGCIDWTVRQICLFFLEPAGPDQIFSLYGTETPIPSPDPPPDPGIPPSCEGIAATIIAEAGIAVVGTPGDDVILGSTEPDQIDAGGGDDLICGRTGDDVVKGSGGDDVIRGYGGFDDLSGGEGNDRIRGGDGADTVDGGEGNDHLSGRRGGDFILGGPGEDELHANAGADDLHGGDDEDTCHGAAETDLFESCELGTGRRHPPDGTL